LQFVLEKFMRGFFYDAGCIDKMKIRIIQRVTPYTVTSHHTVATVRDDNTGKIIITIFHAKIKTAPDKGADDCFQECISFGDRFMNIAPVRKGMQPDAVINSTGQKNRYTL
jgi:hypothetical protein